MRSEKPETGFKRGNSRYLAFVTVPGGDQHLGIPPRRLLCQLGKFPPGKGFPRPETGSRFLAKTADSTRQRQGSRAPPSPKPREDKDNSPGARKPDSRRTAWWRTHSTATGLHPEFPDNREINREFFDFGPFSAILIPNRRVNSGGYNKIPYATEQGIFSAEQGIFLREQGISAGQQGSGIGEPISSGRKHPGTGMRRQVSAWFSTKALPGMARPIAA